MQNDESIWPCHSAPMNLKLTTLLLLCCFNINAAVIAILDNGVDHSHYKLKNNIYKNYVEVQNNRDDDRNGYVDDVMGWNFIAMNNVVFDFEREIYLTHDIERYYHLRAKDSLGTITEVEDREYSILKKDKELKERRSEFTSWMHGTHIAGIAANTSELPEELEEDDILLLPIVYLGDATSGPALAPEFKPTASRNLRTQRRHLNSYWKEFMAWQVNKFKLGARYAASKAQVANGSFGQSFGGIQDRMKSYYKEQIGQELSEEDSFKAAQDFMVELMVQTEKVLKKFPNTLFVFSAGNKKNDSDIYIHFPSAARLPNVLSVGASFEYNEMAYFSNFGKETVDLFAPGLAIHSTIPRQGHLRINGTSQASPFVANTAAKAIALAKKLNIKISIKDIRKIILLTVNKKDELREKSVAGGIIHPARVYKTIRLLRRYSLSRSINYANSWIPDMAITHEKSDHKGLFIELPTP
ncbi:putative serine protease [Halobacteriovorax marinus SJ]|uniref:Serine protease n=2 Tax=Halobacteriovorax marinus TaxID=97084 RepID=E1X3P0_HALMS|nr:putative serine protease [Halobacteriovorax marinus SJ]